MTKRKETVSKTTGNNSDLKTSSDKKTTQAKKPAVPKKTTQGKKPAPTKKSTQAKKPAVPKKTTQGKKPAVPKKTTQGKKPAPKKVKEPITVTAYARHRKDKGLKGGTHQAVKKAIDSARLLKSIKEIGNKKMIISAVEADKEWDSKTTPETQIDNNDPEQQQLSLEAKKTSQQYTGARARRLEAQAEIAELELSKLKGELLDLVRARQQLTTIGKELSQAFYNISRSKAAELAAETNPQIIRVTLKKMLDDLANGTIKQLQKVVPSGK